MTTVIVVLSRPLSNYCYMPSLKQLLFYVVPQSSDKQSLILGVLPPGLSINRRTVVMSLENLVSLENGSVRVFC